MLMGGIDLAYFKNGHDSWPMNKWSDDKNVDDNTLKLLVQFQRIWVATCGTDNSVNYAGILYQV